MSDDKIAEIRKRHEEGVRAGADEDRAWLLDEVERLRQEMIGLWARVAKARPGAESGEP